MATLSVIIAAHGSSTHSGGAVVADRCRKRLEGAGFVTGLVLTALWKGEGLRLNQAITACPPGHVLIIPLLMSDGYFAEKIFPREFCTPVQSEGWDDQGAHKVRLTSAAGLDPRFDTLVLAQAVELLRRSDHPRLILAGHGTERDPTSSRRLYDLADQVRAAAPETVDRLLVGFLDEQPTVTEALKEVSSDPTLPTVILPWFSADGMHVADDIPDAVRDWGGSADVLPSVGVSLFPQICESRARDAFDTIRLQR